MPGAAVAARSRRGAESFRSIPPLFALASRLQGVRQVELPQCVAAERIVHAAGAQLITRLQLAGAEDHLDDVGTAACLQLRRIQQLEPCPWPILCAGQVTAADLPEDEARTLAVRAWPLHVR